MKHYIPNQHGAWAMLVVPFLFGMIASQPKPAHLLLFVCWLLGYLWAYSALQLIRTKRTDRFLQPVLVYGTILAPCVTALLIIRPDLLRFAVPMIPLLLINGHFARINRERALANDIAAVVQFSIIVFIAYAIGGGNDWPTAGRLFAISVLYFIGTAFYVKTIIREKHNRAFYVASIGYHLMLLLALGWIGSLLMLVPGAVLLARAIVSPRAKLTVRQAGMLEIAYSLLMTAFVWWAFA